MNNKKIFQRNLKQTLRFSPAAWAKLIFMRDLTDNEVAGFGITATDDLLFVKDFVIVKQKVTTVSFRFDDVAVGNFFEDQVDLGRKPEQFARIWLHSHPGSSPQPSCTDEETFDRVFGVCDWSIMFIVARNGNTYARLRFNVGPGGEVNIPVCVDYSCEFEKTEFDLWKQLYIANVSEDVSFMALEKSSQANADINKPIDVTTSKSTGNVPSLSAYDVLSEIDRMNPTERDMFMDELAIRSDFWEQGSEVFND